MLKKKKTRHGCGRDCEVSGFPASFALKSILYLHARSVINSSIFGFDIEQANWNPSRFPPWSIVSVCKISGNKRKSRHLLLKRRNNSPPCSIFRKLPWPVSFTVSHLLQDLQRAATNSHLCAGRPGPTGEGARFLASFVYRLLGVESIRTLGFESRQN